ncbi:MAG: hypothetical protein ACR2ND_12765 [Solirubrobacteraceae bacterium]
MRPELSRWPGVAGARRARGPCAQQRLPQALNDQRMDIAVRLPTEEDIEVGVAGQQVE